jgi:hypothetical protein
VGGTFGNRTGRETVVRSYYNFPWSCVLRFHGTPAPIPSPKDDVMSPITLTVTADGTFRAAVMAGAGSSSSVVDAGWITWGSTFGATEFVVSCLDEAGDVMQNGRRTGVIANNRRAFMQLPSGVVMAVVEGHLIDHDAVPAAALVTKAR